MNQDQRSELAWVESTAASAMRPYLCAAPQAPRRDQVVPRNNNLPIDRGPFTGWNPRSWKTFHGDGSLICAGPGGKPVPTIRLENFRDGLEDYAYALILEEIVRRYEAKGTDLSVEQAEWLAKARAALPVPEALVKSLSEFSRNPAILGAYRDRLADLIDASGMPDADPWPANFGVRGFRGGAE